MSKNDKRFYFFLMSFSSNSPHQQQKAQKGPSAFMFTDMFLPQTESEPQRATTGSMTPVRTTEKPPQASLMTRMVPFSRPDTPPEISNLPAGTTFRIRGTETELHFISLLNNGQMLMTNNETNEAVWIQPQFVEIIH